MAMTPAQCSDVHGSRCRTHQPGQETAQEHPESPGMLGTQVYDTHLRKPFLQVF